MKAVSKHRYSVGELINQFNNQSDQTVRSFNVLFSKCKILGFDDSLKVEIGDYDKGRRKITLNDSIYLEHDFNITSATREAIRNPFCLLDRAGSFIGQFNNSHEAIRFLNTNYELFLADIENSKYLVKENYNGI